MNDIGTDVGPWRSIRLPGLGPEQVALVTGGTGAIGRRIVEAFAAMGVRVGVMSRSEERLEQVVHEAPEETRERLLAIPGDVSRRPDGLGAVDALLGRWGRLDVLVHAAAIGDSGSELEDLTPEEIDEVLAVNVKGTLLVAQAAARPMRAQRSGRMVLVASIAAFRAAPRGNVYGASKAAVIRLARQLAVELGPHGVRVNSVSPAQTPTILRAVGEEPGRPPVRSKGGNEATIPIGRRGELDDYVGAVAFLASDLSSYTTGIDLLVDGGVSVRR